MGRFSHGVAVFLGVVVVASLFFGTAAIAEAVDVLLTRTGFGSLMRGLSGRVVFAVSFAVAFAILFGVLTAWYAYRSRREQIVVD